MAELYQGKFSGEEIDSRLDNAKRTCRFVIGTSTAGWTDSDCDYLCDGTADDIEINAAIQALPETGGKIVILDGVYNITKEIEINKNNTHISGNGGATIFKRGWHSENHGGEDSVFFSGLVLLQNNDSCSIKNITFDNNKENYESIDGSYNAAICINNSTNNIVSDNIFIGSDDKDIRICSNNNFIVNNTIKSTKNNNISIEKGNENYISNNILLGALEIEGRDNDASNNIITNNTIKDGISLDRTSMNLISQNTIICADSYSIRISRSKNDSITSNMFIGGDYSIYPQFEVDAVTISNNTTKDCGLILAYDGSVSNSVINGNYCSYLSTGEPTIVFNNCSNNLIINNYLSGNQYSDDGTKNIWINNFGDNKYDSGLKIGFFYYTGDDTSTRSFTLDFVPKFCTIYAVKQPPTVADMTTPSISLCYWANAIQGGENKATQGALLNGNNLTVYNDPDLSMSQTRRKLNASSIDYVVVAWY